MKATEIDRRVDRLRAPRLDAREVEQAVDQPQEAQGIAVDHLRVVAQRGRQRPPRPVQLIAERPQQQSQRRAELVADVAEERGLGAVELGQRLGPRASRPRRRPRWRCRSRSAPRPGAGSSGTRRRAAGTGSARPPARPASADRQHHRLRRRPRPGPRRQRPQLRLAAHRPRSARAPAAPRAAGQRRPSSSAIVVGRGGVAGRDPRGAGQRRGLRLGLDQVDQRERQIVGVRRHREGGQRARLAGRARVGGAGRQLPQQRQPALAQDARACRRCWRR